MPKTVIKYTFISFLVSLALWFILILFSSKIGSPELITNFGRVPEILGSALIGMKLVEKKNED